MKSLISVFLPLLATVAIAKPHVDCSKIRGACYQPGPEGQVRRELGYGRRVGLNTIRFWMFQKEYEEKGDAYLKEVVAFVRTCHSCGYRTMPVVFNGNMLDLNDVKPEAYPAADRYLKATLKALGREPGLLMFDMMNEPLCNKHSEQADVIWGFLRHQLENARKQAPDCLFTVGYTTGFEIEASTAGLVDVISFHDYSETREKARRNYDAALAWGKKLGKPVLQTETGCLARANPYEMALELCHEYKMGWIVYELMIGGRCIDEHGVFYPDGTIRDAGTIAAMFGCFRNRGEKCEVVPPNPNREGRAEEAIKLIKSALKEYTSDAFDYRRSDRKALLDACEVAANLLEACELVPMCDLPTARIAALRKDPKADIWEIRKLAYELANRLKAACQIVD